MFDIIYLKKISTLFLNLMNKPSKEIIVIDYVRTVKEAVTVHGKFYSGKVVICLGIENPNYLIRPGKYEIVRYQSPSNGTCLLLKGVEGRSYLEIHKANWSHQLKGCIAPVALVVNGMGWSSKKSLQAIFDELEPYDKWYINITEKYVWNEFKSV